jgi:hypothetical protein
MTAALHCPRFFLTVSAPASPVSRAAPSSIRQARNSITAISVKRLNRSWRTANVPHHFVVAAKPPRRRLVSALCPTALLADSNCLPSRPTVPASPIAVPAVAPSFPSWSRHRYPSSPVPNSDPNNVPRTGFAICHRDICYPLSVSRFTFHAPVLRSAFDEGRSPFTELTS